MWKLVLSVLTVAFGVAGAAHASATITLTPAFPTVEAGNDLNVVLAYSIQGASAGDALVVVLPPDVGVAGWQVPTDNNGQAAFGGGCVNVANSMPWQSGCDFTFIGTGASSSGTIELTLRTSRFAFPEGTTNVSLSATFTSTAGGHSDAVTLGITAHSDLGIWGGHFSLNTTQLVSYQPAGAPAATPGRMVTVTTLYYNNGTAPYEDLVHGVLLPTAAHYANSNVPAQTPNTTIASLPSVGSNAVHYQAHQAVGRPLPISGDGLARTLGVDYADVVQTQYFVSCDDIAAAYDTNGQVLPGVRLYPNFEADASVPLVGGGTGTDTFDYEFTGAVSYVPRCTSGGSAGKWHEPAGRRAAGEQIAMGFVVSPPDRVPVEDVVAIDALPTNVTLVGTQSYSWAGYSTSFEFWLCRIPAHAGALITSAEFLASYRGTAACYQKPDTSAPAAPPWPIGETTHLALYAPTWADPGPYGDTVKTAYVYSQVIIDADAAHDDTVTNRLHAEGVDFGPFDSVDAFQINNALDYYVGISSQQTPVFSETYNPGTVASPTTFILAASFWRDGGLLKNPSMLVTLAPGMEPDLTYGDLAHGFNGYYYPLNCTNAPATSTLPVPTWTKDTKGTADPLDDQWSILFDMDPIGGGDWFSQGCNAGDMRHTDYFRVRLVPGYPFVTDEPNIVTVQLDVDNPGAPGATTTNFSAFVRMPKEMRVTTSQGCGDGPGEPQIVTGFVNSAGTNLTDVVVTVPIPRVGSPAGTEVDTVFVAMTPPTTYTGGYTQEYSTDGTTWLPIAGVAGHEADVRWVRTTLDQLDAYTSGTFGVTLRHVVPATFGDSITFTATIDSAELAPVDVLAPTEYIVGGCYALVHVTKSFDDGSGAGGPLAGWTFEARRDGELVDVDTTDDDGTLTLQLPPGTYQVTEVLQVGGQITWTPTSQAGPTRTVVVDWEDSELDVAFTNACSCASDACATYDCVYPGTCVVAEELDCGEVSCDPITGNVPDLVCAAQIAVAYAIVYDAAKRPVGTVRCAQELDGTVACDEVAPGKLHVYEGLFCPGIVEGVDK